MSQEAIQKGSETDVRTFWELIFGGRKRDGRGDKLTKNESHWKWIRDNLLCEADSAYREDEPTFQRKQNVDRVPSTSFRDPSGCKK